MDRFPDRVMKWIRVGGMLGLIVFVAIFALITMLMVILPSAPSGDAVAELHNFGPTAYVTPKLAVVLWSLLVIGAILLLIFILADHAARVFRRRTHSEARSRSALQTIASGVGCIILAIMTLVIVVCVVWALFVT